MRGGASGLLRNLGFVATANAERLQACAGNVFAAAGYRPVSPSVVTSADVFLDRLGERFRSQTLVFEDGRGALLCLRPEMTIPAARIALDEGFRGGSCLKLSYAGSVFRLDGEGALHQAMQAGIEHLGDVDAARADADVVALACQAVRACGVNEAVIRFSDLALFHALIASLGLKPHQRAHVLRRFDAAGSAMFAFRTAFAPPAASRPLDPAQAQRLIGEGQLLCGVREADEIACRLAERASIADEGPIPPRAQDILAAFFALSFEAGKAADGIARFFEDHNLPAPDLASFNRRLTHLQALSSALRFDARVHAPLGYYSGLEFRIEARGINVAGGGRYDRLLPELLNDPSANIPAVGAAIFLDALAEHGA